MTTRTVALGPCRQWQARPRVRSRLASPAWDAYVLAHSPEFVVGRKAAEELFVRGEYGQPLDDVIAELDTEDSVDPASA